MSKRQKSTATGDDRISALPDEILLCILRRLQSTREAALTTALSKRWRSPWQSYPVAELNRRRVAMKYLENFGNATIERIVHCCPFG
ncbi:F-box/FBD/LRR-repeat protein At1g80470 [Linum perenne]